MEMENVKELHHNNLNFHVQSQSQNMHLTGDSYIRFHVTTIIFLFNYIPEA